MRSLRLSSSTLVIAAMLAAPAALAQATPTPLVGQPPMATPVAPAVAPGTEAAPVPSHTTPVMMAPIQQVPAPATIDSAGDGAIPALPLEVQQSGGVTFINGGVGDEEVAEFKTKEKEFNLHVLISAPQGEFIGDANLSLVDSKGNTLVSINDAGPYFYAQLQPGTYTLQASANGEQKKLSITISPKSVLKQQLVFKEAGGITSPHQPTARVD